MPRKKQQETELSAQACATEGCTNPGLHKAPKDRQHLRDYQWLCTDHVREFNRRWDYFSGMNQDEIELFMHDALTGHRPTWVREEVANGKHALNPEQLEAALDRFLFGKAKPTKKPVDALPPKERKALSVLELEDRVSITELKKHYRKLAKEHHPDAHLGDRTREEMFKRITEAYTFLMKLSSKS